jgi:hypothetical protein
LYTLCVLGAPYADFYKITITYQKNNNIIWKIILFQTLTKGRL